MTTKIRFLIAFATLALIYGCGGSGEIIVPSGELTPEQQAKVKAEDQQVEDEESQGSNKKQ
jgi:predicted small lipoprotein YifL